MNKQSWKKVYKVINAAGSILLLCAVVSYATSYFILSRQTKALEDAKSTPEKAIRYKVVNGGFIEACKRIGMDLRGFKVTNVEVVPEQDKAGSYLIYLTLNDPKGETSEYKFNATYDEENNKITYDIGMINEIRLRTKTSTLLKK